jgi:UDP-N-acetylglucosamine--N-acetylmuramyl-(pentapeptide) pyrophosphoryl-undecaprenol N-acetylglucosamine transferase
VARRFRLLVAGGGTGGHITPGLAVIEAVRRRIREPAILWVGVKGRREEDMVPRHNIHLRTLELRGLEREFRPLSVYRNFCTALNWLTFKPVRKALTILREFKPDFALATGGYVCAPIVIAARMEGIQCWILEQNSIPGLTVRKLANRVDGVGIAYEVTRKHLSSRARIEFIGNPVLRSVLTASKKDGIVEFGLKVTRKTLFVMGGSLGSETLNTAIRDLLKIDQDAGFLNNWQIIHVTGSNKYERFIRTVPDRPNYHPFPFLYNAPKALAAADLVICRGGAMTLAEVTARGLPSIIVPWPGAVRDHQTMNAVALEEAGAAWLVREANLSGIYLADMIRSFNARPGSLSKMALRARDLGRPDAADRMVDFMLTRDYS